MWFNSTLREEPYLGLTSGEFSGNREVPRKRSPKTGAAWLSSARAVRCWVKSRNERNPYPYLPSGNAGHSMGTASVKLEEGGDDVKSSWPLCPGLHTCYNGRYKGLQTREGEPIQKNRSQFGSKSATRPREAGIASNRGFRRPGEIRPRAWPPPPVTPQKLFIPEVGELTARGPPPKVWPKTYSPRLSDPR